MISFFKYTMKIAAIFVTDRRNDITDRKIRLTHQLNCLVQSLALQKLLKIEACIFLDHLAQHVHRKMQLLTKLCKRCCPVLLLNIIQSSHCDHILVLIRESHLCILHRLQKIQKNKSHRCLIDAVLIALARHQ